MASSCEVGAFDSDDEFHDRLAEVYREHSPSRRRRLARGDTDNSAQHPAQLLALCGDGFFAGCGHSPCGQLLGDGGIVHAAPQCLSQVHMHGPLQMLVAPVPSAEPCPPPLAAPTLPEGLLAERRASDDSSEGIRAVDLALREGESKQSAGGSTRQPSSPGSEVAPEDAQDSEKWAPEKPPCQRPVVSLPVCLADHLVVGPKTRTSNASTESAASAARGAAASSGAEDAEARNMWGEGVTTAMVRQLPRNYTHLMFLREVASRGFEGLFDFIYFPYDLKKGCNVGFGFVNFVSPEYALAFRKAFDGVCLDEMMRLKGKPLRIHPASVQGYEANCRYYSRTKTGQQRDPRFSPLFLPGGSWQCMDEGLAAQLRGSCDDRWPEATPQAPQAQPMPVTQVQVPRVEASWRGDQWPHAGAACVDAAASVPSANHAGSTLLMPRMQAVKSQWSTLEEERQRLLQELASVRQGQRALVGDHCYLASATGAPQAVPR